MALEQFGARNAKVVNPRCEGVIPCLDPQLEQSSHMVRNVFLDAAHRSGDQSRTLS